MLKKKKLDGIGWFAFENLKRITRSHPEHEFLFISDHPLESEFLFSENIIPVVIPPPARHPVLWYIWTEWSLTQTLRKYNPGIYFSSDGFLSLSSRIPSLPVIHDINFHHRPGDLPFFQRNYYRRYFPGFAGKAELIATVSEFSKKDISTSYGIREDKIYVVYNGVNNCYRPLDEKEKICVRKSVSGGAPYFIFIGSIHPRKNIVNLLKAFEIFRQSVDRYKLLITGERMFHTGEITETHKNMNFRDDVIFTGRYEPSELFQILGGAEALTYFPFFEGFGIPLAEAMYSEVPIIASDASAIPEIAGKAALYANPSDICGIADLMIKINSEKNVREKLIREGRAIRGRYSWDRSAETLWKLILQIV